jgi:hypothetical protein
MGGRPNCASASLAMTNSRPRVSAKASADLMVTPRRTVGLRPNLPTIKADRELRRTPTDVV